MAIACWFPLEAASETESRAQDDFSGVLLGSTPAERRGRKQKQAEGEVGPGGRPDNRLGQTPGEVWS